MTERRESPVLAVDIGGTKMMTAIFSADGRMLVQDVCPTLAHEGVSGVVERLFMMMDRLLDQRITEIAQLAGVGIACAGGVDTARGLITFSPNLPGWHDVALAEMVKERYEVETFLVNDASAAALGEQHYGAGKGIKNLVLLTLGTGVGGGIVINGELYLGACGSAAEIGHMVIDVNGPECSCGNRGCLESIVSGTAVARSAVTRIRQGEESTLVEMVEGETGKITAEMVGEAARHGDALAVDVLSRAAYYLGVGLENIVNIFNPEMIILGGGMAEEEELFIEPAKQVVMSGAFQISVRAVRIVTAQLGNDAGVYGAAAYAFEHVSRRPE